MTLAPCSSCGSLLKPATRCPFCDVGRSRLGHAAGAVAFGLALGGCPADEENDTDAEQMTESATSNPTSPSGSDTTFGPEPAYGVGETGLFTTGGPLTDSGPATDTGSTTTPATDTGANTGTETDTATGSATGENGGLGDCIGLGVWPSCAVYCDAVGQSCSEAGCDGATAHYYGAAGECADLKNGTPESHACDDPLLDGGNISFARCCCE